ncbi:MAG TPA: chemotaxis protein CheD [Deltaproteobacteria bacterium]|jgi:chemotaxis protein CheD|nr:chemotaxis protein CheD [Deltaproteobacteria bacterium]HOI05984.1 chemotaxis protein CheD [Deltaproteobacteria bacterium]
MRRGPCTRTHYLKPGEVFLSQESALITTVLGSCISITMYHKPTGLSIMCHAVMPSRTDARKKHEHNVFQYVDSSIEWMVAQYEKKGINPSSVEVKMFGGAAMFPDARSRARDLGVGRKNIETALEVLKKHRMNLSAWNVGGSQGRKLIFSTLTGEVLARLIIRTDSARAAAGGKQ